MLVRSKETNSNLRWRRRGRGRHDDSRSAPPVEDAVQARDAAPRASGIAVRGREQFASSPTIVPVRDRRGGPSEDRALYTCQCGYVFEALVSTSVGCPHCGSAQAW
jgi:hypothetical protein